jgi:hypothetical protein
MQSRVRRQNDFGRAVAKKFVPGQISKMKNMAMEICLFLLLARQTQEAGD